MFFTKSIKYFHLNIYDIQFNVPLNTPFYTNYINNQQSYRLLCACQRFFDPQKVQLNISIDLFPVREYHPPSCYLIKFT